MSPRAQVREYTVSGSTLTKTAGFAWDNPNKNSGGFTFVDGAPAVVDSGAVYRGSGNGSEQTVQVCFSWASGSYRTNASPIAEIRSRPRERVLTSLPVRSGLQKQVYFNLGSGWYRESALRGENETAITVGDGLGLPATPPTSNSFPNADPATLKSTNDKFEVKGDGSGKWGPLTFGADGSMSGIPKMAHGTVVLTPPADNTTVTAAVTFPTGMFSQPPSVVVSADTTVPGTNVQGVSTTNITATSFDAVLRRTNAVASRIYWIAMGV